MKSLLYAATTMLLAACLVGGCKPASETPVLEGLSLAESEIELAVGELRSLEVVVTPPDARNGGRHRKQRRDIRDMPGDGVTDL